MDGVRKQFNPALAEWGTRGEREFIRQWIRGHGYEYTIFPNGRNGIDGRARNDAECFDVEVERSQFNRWNGDRFKYPTIHILERRARYGNSGWMHFTVREDGLFAIITFPQSITPDRKKPNPNKMVRSGEMAFFVPIIETLCVDLRDAFGDPIAVLNADRVRRLAAGKSGRLAMDLLGDWPPYGMDPAEWKLLRDAAEAPIRAEALGDFCKCTDDPQQWLFSEDRYKRKGWQNCHCGKCGKWIGYKPLA